jgi:hypothetical protein
MAMTGYDPRQVLGFWQRIVHWRIALDIKHYRLPAVNF